MNKPHKSRLGGFDHPVKEVNEQEKKLNDHSSKCPTSNHTNTPSSYDILHPKNPYYRKPPDFIQLLQQFPEQLKEYIHLNTNENKAKIDWTNPQAVKILNQALLFKDFQIKIQFLDHFLCPPLPNRLNYLCYLSDLFECSLTILSNSTSSITTHSSFIPHVLDIGTGSTAIYPILGAKVFRWRFSGSDIQIDALNNAQQILQQNPEISSSIQLLHTSDSLTLQSYLNTHNLTSSVSKDVKLLSLYAELLFSKQQQQSRKPSSNIISDAFRGPIRVAFAQISINHQQRLLDCEYQWLQTIQSHEKSENTEELSNRKSKRRDYDENEDDSLSKIENHHESFSPTGQYLPIISAVMTNPPFYDQNESILTNEETICTGNVLEMKTIGGEIAFITTMILDSLILRQNVAWYTAMVGKKSSITTLKHILLQEGIPNSQIFVETLSQGVTHRWMIIWTFLPEIAALYHSYRMLKPSLPLLQTSDSQSISLKIDSQCDILVESILQTITEIEKQSIDMTKPYLTLTIIHQRIHTIYTQIQTTLQHQNIQLLAEDYQYMSFVTGKTNAIKWILHIHEIVSSLDVVNNLCQIQCQVSISDSEGCIKPLFQLQTTISLVSITNIHMIISISQLQCSQGLANRLFPRIKDIIEQDFIRSNRRWRRMLHR